MKNNQLIHNLKANPLLIYKPEYQNLLNDNESIIEIIKIDPFLSVKIKLTDQQLEDDNFILNLLNTVIMSNCRYLMEWFNSSLNLKKLMPLLKNSIQSTLDKSWNIYISCLCQKSVFFFNKIKRILLFSDVRDSP